MLLSKRRMVGWQPLTVENTAALVPNASVETTAAKPEAAPQPSAASVVAVSAPSQPTVAQSAVPAPSVAATEPAAAPVQPAVSSGPIQDPSVPRRRMAGWQPLTVAHDAPVAAPAAAVAPETTAAPSAAPVEASTPAAAQAAPAAVVPAPVTEDLPRRRMDGWTPLQVGHPDTVAPVAVEQPPPTPAADPTPAPVAETAPAPRRMGAPATAPTAAAAEPEVKTPDVVTPTPSTPAVKQSAAAASDKPAPKKALSKPAKIALTLLGVAVLAAVVVLVAQWVRTLDPVAEFIGTYDGTPTHPDGVVAGIPAWVGWQHFFNFFIIVMVIRSGLLIRNQERPEAYWTPNDGGFYSPNKQNAPQKVSIQQWIHQSFNVLWVVNGLVFYVMVFVTGHWMRITPTNWDIFPNIVSAGIQYLSLDWPAENSWVYYNALQIMTYFLTVFIAAPIAVLTGLRLSTWWPQKAEGINKAFTLPVARKIHFFTMVYFILFIIVHLFLVFTTGVLTNMNMMFAARDASDWWGIAVFAVSVAVTVGVAWLIKPIFISPIAEKTGTVSTR